MGRSPLRALPTRSVRKSRRSSGCHTSGESFRSCGIERCAARAPVGRVSHFIRKLPNGIGALFADTAIAPGPVQNCANSVGRRPGPVRDIVNRDLSFHFDVIGVVPNDEAALEPVLKKAMDAGIKVVAHEGPGLNNVDWNFELASADGFGEAHAKLLCEKTEEPGTYAVYVGSLTVPLHNAWADAGIEWLANNCADKLQPVGDRYGVAESSMTAARRHLT